MNEQVIDWSSVKPGDLDPAPDEGGCDAWLSGWACTRDPHADPFHVAGTGARVAATWREGEPASLSTRRRAI